MNDFKDAEKPASVKHDLTQIYRVNEENLTIKSLCPILLYLIELAVSRGFTLLKALNYGKR